MLKNTLLLVVVVAVGFWFWYEPEEEGPSEEELQLQKNARLIKECIQRERSLNAAAQKTGGVSLAVDSEALCSEKYNLYQADGQWYRLKTNDNDPWESR